MLVATLLALGAAVLHAGWNYIAKRADGDRVVVLWAQFAMGGMLSAALLIVHAIVVGMPGQGYAWAAASGLVHVPYVWLLARAYTIGDFSISYPIARGGGAALAALGGVLLLSDHLNVGETLGIATIVGGLFILSWGVDARHVAVALMLSVTIGVYTVIDARGSRVTDSVAYVLATFVAAGITNTAVGLATGRRHAMVQMLRNNGRRALLTGAASVLTYGLVLVAIQRADVGYVTALRESSVVLAALAGWKLLGEGDHRRRITAAGVVLTGLLVLVATG